MQKASNIYRKKLKNFLMLKASNVYSKKLKKIDRCRMHQISIAKN